MHALLALSLLVSCRKIEPAPEDLDGLFHWLWDNYELAADDELAEASANLREEAGAEALEEMEDGTLSDLLSAQIDGLPIEGPPDPEEGRGMYLLNAFACDLSQLEKILYDLDQGALYDEAYDTYERAYLSDLDAYTSRQSPAISWEVELTGEYVGADFTEWLQGGLRYVEDTPLGPVLIARTFMTRPAEFEEGSSKVFSQDYQIEFYYERSPGEIFHAYGIWRELDMGGGLTMEDDSVVRIILNNLADWDQETEKLCEEGAP